MVHSWKLSLFSSKRYCSSWLRHGRFVYVAPATNISGKVWWSDFTCIGASAVVNQGSNLKKLEVGENTIVGSGKVVVRACEADAFNVGVPAWRI